MSTPSSPAGGRRANGLPSSDWGALVDLDPRLSEALLDRLAAAGVPAYVEPAGGTPDQLVRAVSHPSRPLDRLWVAPDRADAARSVVTAEVADLTALLAEQDPAATAHGFVQPVPRTAATRVLAPPALPLPRPEPEDPDEVFRQIVAGYGRESEDPVPPWPVAEDVEEGRGRRGDAPAATDASPGRRLRRRTDAPEPDAAALPAWVEPEALEDDGHFEPPAPPPAPRFSARTVASVAAVVFGVVLMFAPGLVGQYAGLGIGVVGVGLFLGGVAALIWSMRDAPPTDSDPDDGAVV